MFLPIADLTLAIIFKNSKFRISFLPFNPYKAWETNIEPNRPTPENIVWVLVYNYKYKKKTILHVHYVYIVRL